MEVTINYWAVLVCAIVAIGIGIVWYGPLFGKKWMKLIDMKMPEEITPAMKREMYKSYVVTAISSFVMAYVLAHTLYFATVVTRMTGVEAGLQVALWSWIGFVVPVSLLSVTWEGRPWKYWFIVAGYYLVTLAVMGVILSVWPA